MSPRKINIADSIAASIDKWIFDSYSLTAEHLGIYRILYAGFNLVFLFGFNFDWLAQLPNDFYTPPPGIAQLWGGFPSPVLIHMLNLGIVISDFLLLVGWRTFWASIAHSLFLLLAFSLVFSLGNTYHIILWLLVPFVMAFSGWGSTCSLDAKKRTKIKKVSMWPITLMSLLVGFAFFTAGFAKLMGGWLSTDGSAVWQYFINVRNSVGRSDLLSDYLLGIDSGIFWEALDWSVVIFETGFLIAIFWKRLFRIFCIAGLIFHLGVLLILNISFAIHLVVFLLFIPWAIFMEATKKNRQQIEHLWMKVSSRKYFPFIAVLLFLVYLIAFYCNPFPNMVDGARLIEWFAFAVALFGLAWYYLRGR